MSERSNPFSARALRWLVPLALLALAIIVVRQLPISANWQQWAEQEGELRDLAAANPVLAPLVAVGIYSLVAGLSLPGATLMTLACGWIFGFWVGLLIASFGSTAGASIAFLLSRYLLRDWVRDRWGERLEGWDRAIARDGPWYLFSLRLLVGAPYFLINLGMGLTPIGLFPFWWISQLGMLPATAAYVYAGSQLPSLEAATTSVGDVIGIRLVIALAIVGVLPLLLRFVVRRWFPLAEDCP